jgi:hypothetical protein
MKWGLAVLLCLAQLGFGTEPSPMQRLQARVHVQPVAALTPANLAGKYSHPTKEFSPGLSGDDLYLFPDGTYIYDEWSDIQALTIYDKGKWEVENGIIVLSSDKEISWDPGEEHQYIAVARHSHPGEVLLMGTGPALTRFEESQDSADNHPEADLMIFAKERSSPINAQKAADRIRKKLMRTAWNPGYFRDASK